MALRNISLYLRYSRGEHLLQVKYPFTPSVSHFNSINNSITFRKSGHKGYVKSLCDGYHISSNYGSLFFISRSLSIDGPQTGPDSNIRNGAPKLPPIKPDKIAEVVQEVQKSTLKIDKLLSTDHTIKKPETIEELKKEPATVVKVSLLTKIKNEILHYYHGSRLFVLETKVTSGIVFDLMRGHTLTRRERKQLVRTIADLFRLVPFAVFIVVPFMELLLPFYIKFFPFMMPSTFAEKSKEAEKMHQLLKGKLEMAKFLQDTLDETTNSGKYKTDGKISLETFNNFMKQARDSGHTARTDDIVKFSRLFEDEVTLESLEHKQVKALCKLLDINSIGPKALLNIHLRMRVNQLKIDDKMIIIEGISKVPTYELQQLCRERGMRAMGVSEERLRFQLKQWLKLSIEDQVPISLLLLSRTMYLPDSLSAEEQLTKTILNLPESASKEASLLTSSETAKVDYKTMFEVIKEEQEAIREEKEAKSKRMEKEILADKAPVITIPTEDVPIKKTVEDESISSSDLAHLENAIEHISGAQTSIQEEELDELKEQAAEWSQSAVSESGAKTLNKKLLQMIHEMDSLVDKLDVEHETLLKKAGSDFEVKSEEERMIAIGDLLKTLRQVKTASHDEEKWRKILDILDEDHDGRIEVHHVMEMMEVVSGSDDVKLSRKEIARLLDTIDKEEVIEKEEEDGQVVGEAGKGGVGNKY